VQAKVAVYYGFPEEYTDGNIGPKDTLALAPGWSLGFLLGLLSSFYCFIRIIVSIKDHHKRRRIMGLTPPEAITLWISVVLAVIGFVGVIVSIPFISTYAFWFLFAGYILPVLGLLVKGLRFSIFFDGNKDQNLVIQWVLILFYLLR
jgi:hypothetical protein